MYYIFILFTYYPFYSYDWRITIIIETFLENKLRKLFLLCLLFINITYHLYDAMMTKRFQKDNDLMIVVLEIIVKFYRLD